MPTECSAELFEFGPVDGWRVVASFDGGAIRLTERFAACFTDGRTPKLVEHNVETLVMQRVIGIVLG